MSDFNYCYKCGINYKGAHMCGIAGPVECEPVMPEPVRLTKREAFAMAAMQGMLANPLLENVLDSSECVYAVVARDAVKHADALLQELSEDKP